MLMQENDFKGYIYEELQVLILNKNKEKIMAKSPGLLCNSCSFRSKQVDCIKC